MTHSTAIEALKIAEARLPSLAMGLFVELNTADGASVSPAAQAIASAWHAAVNEGLNTDPADRGAYFEACQSFRKTTQGALRGFFQRHDAAWKLLSTRHRAWINTIAKAERRAEAGVVTVSISAHHTDAVRLRKFAAKLLSRRGIDPLHIDCRTRRNQSGGGRPRRASPQTEMAAAE